MLINKSHSPQWKFRQQFYIIFVNFSFCFECSTAEAVIKPFTFTGEFWSMKMGKHSKEYGPLRNLHGGNKSLSFKFSNL